MDMIGLLLTVLLEAFIFSIQVHAYRAMTPIVACLLIVGQLPLTTLTSFLWGCLRCWGKWPFFFKPHHAWVHNLNKWTLNLNTAHKPASPLESTIMAVIKPEQVSLKTSKPEETDFMQRVHTVPHATKKSRLLVYVGVLQLTWANLIIYKEHQWFHFFTCTSIFSSQECSLEFRTLSMLNDNFVPILCFTLNILLVMQHHLYFPAEAIPSNNQHSAAEPSTFALWCIL